MSERQSSHFQETFPHSLNQSKKELRRGKKGSDSIKMKLRISMHNIPSLIESDPFIFQRGMRGYLSSDNIFCHFQTTAAQKAPQEIVLDLHSS